jgi:hypothetical protein
MCHDDGDHKKKREQREAPVCVTPPRVANCKEENYGCQWEGQRLVTELRTPEDEVRIDACERDAEC